MLTQFYAPIVGGEESIVRDLSRALARRGHDVAVATTHQPDLAREELDEGVRVYRIKTLAGRIPAIYSEHERRHVAPVPDPEAVVGLRKVTARHRPDVVHGHNWLSRSYIPIKRRVGVPLAISLHDYSLNCATKRLMQNGTRSCSGPGALKCLRCSAMRYGNLQGPLIASGQAVGDVLMRRVTDMFLPVSRVVAERSSLVGQSVPYEIVPNFLPKSFYSSNAPPRSSELPGEPFILYAGDFSSDKGVDVLLHAYQRMKHRMPLVMVGRNAGVASGDIPGVTVLPPRPRESMPDLWQQCAIAVVPSSWEEPFGLVALEALAAGCAVVVTDVGNLADMVEDEVSGLVVPPRDSAALTAALERLVREPQLRAYLGEGARCAAELFSEEGVLGQIEHIYETLAERRVAT